MIAIAINLRLAKLLGLLRTQRITAKKEIGIKSEKIFAKSEVFFCFLGLDFYFGLQKRGDYYDPPYSAECQISKKSGLSLTLPRSLEFFLDRRLTAVLTAVLYFLCFLILKSVILCYCVYINLREEYSNCLKDIK